MSTSDEQAEALRRQMRDVRDDLDHDVAGIVENAKTLADWKHYVKSFPWGAVAASAALGYFAVPQKMQVLSPSAETLEKLAEKNLLVVTTEPKKLGQQKGMVASILAVAGTLALRGATAYLSGRVGTLFSMKGREADLPARGDDHETPHQPGVPR